jgi:hypothetical protein
MIDWIKKVYNAAKGVIPSDVRKWVHNLVAGVAGVVHTVFGHVGREWDEIWRWAAALAAGAEHLASGLSHFYSLIVHKWIPAVRAWASRELSSLRKYAEHVLRWASDHLNSLYHTVQGWISSLTKLTLKHIWDPLYAYVKDIYKKLTDWAYTAWYYITHPDKLAALLYLHLVTLVKRNIWDLARDFGEFGAKLFLSNVPRVITLIEQIIADVL